MCGKTRRHKVCKVCGRRCPRSWSYAMSAASLLFLAAPAAWFVLAAADAACPSDDPGCHSSNGRGLVPEARRPCYARVNGSIETLWQRPLVEPPKGVVFMAHGCMHQATDFFTQRGPDGWELPGCRESNFGSCLGLPEERVMVREARERGYLVVAVSGGRGVQSCWSMDRDPPRVREAIRHVLAAEGMAADAPVIATGASSGGAFMGALAQSGVLGRQLRCIVPQISSIRLQDNRPSAAIHIPTLFVHMPRDRRTAEGVKGVMAFLRAGGNSRVQELLVEPEPVSANFQRHWPPAETARLVAALKTGGLLDQGGYLAQDPRRRGWVAALRGHSPEGDSLAADESPIGEALNAAWAMHEFTSRYAAEMLGFCEGQPLPSRP